MKENHKKTICLIIICIFIAIAYISEIKNIELPIIEETYQSILDIWFRW